VTIYLACCGTNLRYAQAETDALIDVSRRVGVLLGAREVVFGSLPDQGLDTLSLPDVARPLEEALRRFNPDAIWTHHPGDINRDHRILSEAVMVAARPFAAPGVRAIQCFETPSSTEWGGPVAGLPPFLPNRFIDITPVLERKLDACALYTSETRPWPHPRSRQALEHRARHWGSLVGVEAAEAFSVVREIE
jgi:LmbE family N-acetylglucosaminyl deacetylase